MFSFFKKKKYVSPTNKIVIKINNALQNVNQKLVGKEVTLTLKNNGKITGKINSLDDVRNHDDSVITLLVDGIEYKYTAKNIDTIEFIPDNGTKENLEVMENSVYNKGGRKKTKIRRSKNQTKKKLKKQRKSRRKRKN